MDFIVVKLLLSLLKNVDVQIVEHLHFTFQIQKLSTVRGMNVRDKARRVMEK